MNSKNILINAFGIQDSGGITVFDKILSECKKDYNNSYYIFCNDNLNVKQLLEKYQTQDNFKFKIIKNKRFLYRLYYENYIFNKIIVKEQINLIYNFSGSSQIFIKTPQLLKIQNLLFYSKKLDNIYKNSGDIIIWLKQIYFKRAVFKLMAQKSRYLEIQSEHVKNYMEDFMSLKNKLFYIKSDIDVDQGLFLEPKQYDFQKKIKFLYIVGPHFEYTHKNLIDFTNVMLCLEKEDVDYEINITLTKDELENSLLWDNKLNYRTVFLGYISDKKKMQEIFSDNTILISTSIIETLGLHVIEAIKNGIISIVPNEKYAKSVYGKNILSYELGKTQSLLNTIFSIINTKINTHENILTLQGDLKFSEISKEQNIVDIFQKVMNV